MNNQALSEIYYRINSLKNCIDRELEKTLQDGVFSNDQEKINGAFQSITNALMTIEMIKDQLKEAEYIRTNG